MTEGIYSFLDINSNWKIVNSNNTESFRAENNNIILEDVSDSGEFGLTYIIKYKNNYNIYHFDLGEISYKFYS
jgi:hypothetical protein